MTIEPGTLIKAGQIITADGIKTMPEVILIRVVVVLFTIAFASFVLYAMAKRG